MGNPVPFAIEEEEERRLRALLELLAERSSSLFHAVYRRWFEARPDIEDMFAVHAMMTRQQMLDETWVAVMDLLDGAPWLRESLLNTGARHAGYEVQREMYASYRRAILETLTEELDAEHFGPIEERALERALVRIDELAIEGHRFGG